MDTADSRSKWLLVGGIVVVALGSLLPWATVSAGFITVTKAGTEGDGLITLLLALVAGGLTLAKWKAGLGRGIVIASLVIGALVLAIAAYDIVDVSTTTGETELVEVEASVGMGLWLTLLGSIAMVIGAIWELRSPTRSAATTAPAPWGAPPNAAWPQPDPPPHSGQQPMPPSATPPPPPPPS